MDGRITEIFQSIQGEGKYAGVKQVFVRFFGCHMHCGWCDTPAAIGDAAQNFDRLSLEEVFVRVHALWDRCHSVSLTGGEPLLQKDFILQLLPLFKEGGMPVYLETSGVCHQELAAVISGIDVIAMDIKLPSSTQCAPLWEEHEEFLKVIHRWGDGDFFIKAVITRNTSREDVVRMAGMLARLAPEALLILQPNSFELSEGAIQRCLDFQNECLGQLRDVRVLPQTHKFLKLR